MSESPPPNPTLLENLTRQNAVSNLNNDSNIKIPSWIINDEQKKCYIELKQKGQRTDPNDNLCQNLKILNKKFGGKNKKTKKQKNKKTKRRTRRTRRH
jgi:hypothetical protein